MRTTQCLLLLAAARHVHAHGYLDSILDVAHPGTSVDARPLDRESPWYKSWWGDTETEWWERQPEGIKDRQCFDHLGWVYGGWHDTADGPAGLRPEVCGTKLTPFEDAKVMADRGCGGAPNMATGVSRPRTAFLAGQLIVVRWKVSVPHPADVNDTGVRIALHYAADDSFSANILAGGLSGDPPFQDVSAMGTNGEWSMGTTEQPRVWSTGWSVRLPHGKTCDYCTLQWVWASRHDGGVYMGCADISITADGQLPSFDDLPDETGNMLPGVPFPSPPPPPLAPPTPPTLPLMASESNWYRDHYDYYFKYQLLRNGQICGADVVNLCSTDGVNLVPYGGPCNLGACAQKCARENDCKFFMHEPYSGGCAASLTSSADCAEGFIARPGAHFYRLERWHAIDHELELMQKYELCYRIDGWSETDDPFIRLWSIYVWSGVVVAVALSLLVCAALLLHERFPHSTTVRVFAIGLWVGLQAGGFAGGQCGTAFGAGVGWAGTALLVGGGIYRLYKRGCDDCPVTTRQELREELEVAPPAGVEVAIG